jgi:hypothetical protein
LHAAPHNAKRGRTAARLGIPAAAVAVAAGAVTAFVILQGGSAAPRLADHAAPPADAGMAVSLSRMSGAMHHEAAMLESSMIRRTERAARRKHLAALAAARARRAQAAARSASPPPAPPAPVGSGGNAASSALGVCIRNAEEGGSYAWGPGNGGGAYQFVLSTWEHYGGAASAYGSAGPAYQDQVFDNAIAAGGASNWTNYDGC